VNKQLLPMQNSVDIFTHPSTIFIENLAISVPDTLIDSGASSCFIDSDFVKKFGIPTVKKKYPITIEAIDGKLLGSGMIKQETLPLTLEISGHQERLCFNVIQSPSYSVILGMTWLSSHNPKINWKDRTISFDCNCQVSNNIQAMPETLSPTLVPAPAAVLPSASVPESSLAPVPVPASILVPTPATDLHLAPTPAPVPVPALPLVPPVSPVPVTASVQRQGYGVPVSSSSACSSPCLPSSKPAEPEFNVDCGEVSQPLDILPCIDTPPQVTPSSVDCPAAPKKTKPRRQTHAVPSSSDSSPAPSFHEEPLSTQQFPVKESPVTRPTAPEYPSTSSSNSDLDTYPLAVRPKRRVHDHSTESKCFIATLGARSFLKEAIKHPSYVIYATPVSESPSLEQKIPEKYATFADVFSKEKADILPEHRKYDCPIDLKEGGQPPFGPIYNLTQPELKALKEYIDENLAKGFILHSKSPAGAPILFVKKKDGSLRLCVDYRGLNSMTVKNRYPLPLIPQLLDQLSQAKVFTKIDLRGAYNLVRIKKGDEWKTAFRTRYGHFEYTVMPFGLTNAPAVFQHMMNDIFRDYLDQFVVIYLDDLLIFSKSQEEHDKHVALVLEKLREVGLYAKLEKCEFDKDSIEFLGYVISPEGIVMDKSKVDTLLSWAPPTTLKEVQSFLGFANFYRIFIKNYSSLVAPLTALTRKDCPFQWSTQAQQAFDKLKTKFTTAPILAHARFDQPYVVETDGSDFALGAVLSQIQEDGKLHPIAFYSRKFTAAEINYEIYDKELLAIVAAFEQWRHYLCGAQHTTTVFTDHKNLLYYTTTRRLNRRQARWSMFLADFDFEIKYRPGSQQLKPDALSRREEYKPKEGEDCLTNQHVILIKPEKFHINGVVSSPEDNTLTERIRTLLGDDTFAKEIMENLENSPKFSVINGLLFKEGLLYVPDLESRLEILKSRHDSKVAGHYGIRKTVELVMRDYWWPKLWEFIRDYVQSCDVCARSKPSRHKPYGLLMPLEAPKRPWESVSMDFITDLPKSNGCDSILVVVDRFTKMAHFIPCTKKISSEKTAQLFLQHVVRLHGLPKDIVSDRGPQFHSKLWKHLFGLLGTKISLSSAFHPESDGQTERVNQVLEQYLRCTINYLQNDWHESLALAEFSYNNSLHASTRTTPFFANYGFHPKFDSNQLTLRLSPAAERIVENLEQLHHEVRKHLQEAQDSYKQFADRQRKESPLFRIGDLVWLSKRNIKTTRPCDKLDYKKLGPFKILEQINPVTFRLELPPSMLIHNAFHVSLLEPHNENRIPERHLEPPPPVQIDGELEYEVSEILDSKIIGNKLHYLVHWSGYDANERTWEPLQNLGNSRELIKEFHERNPDKPSRSLLPRRRRALRRR
jgi:hypothetical protein